MSPTNKDYLEQLSKILTVIPQKHVNALLTLHKMLEGKTTWILNGDLAERLRLVKVEPEYVEVVTCQDGAKKIFEASSEFHPSALEFQKYRLLRDATVGNTHYPIYTKSYHSEFKIDGTIVKVDGNLQFKVGNWDWGEVFEFDPEYVYVSGKKIAVTPLKIMYDFYKMLGWTDRVEKIEQVLRKPTQKLHS